MAANNFADNAFVYNASLRIQALSRGFRSVPLVYWQKLLIVLALFWVSHSLGKLFWVLYPVADLPTPPTVAQPLSEDSGGNAVAIDLQLLQGVNLSGADAPAPGEAASDLGGPDPGDIGEDVAVSSLNLKLQGIIASSQLSKGKAIIANGNEQALYQVGETLPQGRNVKLAKVLADKVILDNNGNFESLLLYTEADFKGSGGMQVRSSRTGSSRRRSAAAVRSARPEDKLQPPWNATDVENRMSHKVSIDQLKAKSINDVVRFSLHQENGQIAGYRIRPGRDRSLFEQMGLKANDIVTTVNGIAINDRNQLREIYKTMRTATEAQLEVNRGGQVIPITITLDTGG